MAVVLSVSRKKKTILDKLTRIFSKKMPVVVVGFPASKSSASDIEKAIWNEFGTRGSGKPFKTPRGGGFGGPIPERPFMRNAMRNNEAKYKKAIRISAKKILLGETTPEIVLAKLGTQAEQDIKEEITNLSSPPNSALTIKLKGSDNPLIDTGAMRAAVTWKIEYD